jgi:hypothetical protein
MSVAFEADWLPFPDDGDPIVDRTGCRLTIRVDGEPITRVFHAGSKSTRAWVYVPAFPIAEWLLRSHWNILAEPCLREEERAFGTPWWLRHCFATAGSGFHFPPLVIAPEGNGIRLDWSEYAPRHAGIRFESSGSRIVPHAAVEEASHAFVADVLRRLENESLLDTPLHALQRWHEAMDEEEREFCRVAARLGMCPAEVDDATSRELISTFEHLDADRREVLLEFGRWDQVSPLTRWVEGVDSQSVVDSAALLRTLEPLREPPGAAPAATRGYEAAKRLREALDLGDQVHEGLDRSIPLRSYVRSLSLPRLDGFVGLGRHDDRGLLVVSQRHRPESQRFLAARYLGDLFEHSGAMAVISDFRTERQRFSRAFAAEFLAPARLIREFARMPIDEEESADLAARFGVSEMVIQLQARNHAIPLDVPFSLT